MIPVTEQQRLSFQSKPYKRRVGLIPMIAVVACGFLFCLVWFGLSAWLMLQSSQEALLWGVVICLSTVLYAGYLTIASQRLLVESHREYFLELTGSEVILSVIDPVDRKRSTQMVLLSDIKYGEYYPYPDSASVILHTPYSQLEVPLWPLGAQAQDVIDFLEGAGVSIVNVQSDDKIPE